MAIQYSIQKMVSDGTLSTIALGIQYLQRNDIYMRIAGEETPQSGAPSGYTWSFLDNTTLKILPVVPNGVEVVVYRRTGVDAMYNVYSQNAQFDEATIDENNQQLLYIAQEYLEQGLPGAGVDTLEYVRDDGYFTYYRLRRTDGSYSEEFTVPSASNSTKVLTREALRRSYAEAGYNLVDGSFEVGGTLVDANDVLLHEASGKAFSGPAGPIAAGTDPASGGFVDVSKAQNVEIETVAEMLASDWLQLLPDGTVITTRRYNDAVMSHWEKFGSNPGSGFVLSGAGCFFLLTSTDNDARHYGVNFADSAADQHQALQSYASHAREFNIPSDVELFTNDEILIPHANVDISGRINANGATGAFTKGAVVTIGQYSAVQTTTILSAAIIGLEFLDVVSTADLRVGDIITLYDPTDFSFAPHRAYYRAGEHLKISEIVSPTRVRCTNTLFDNYAAGIAVYKLNPTKCSIKNLNVHLGTECAYAVTLESIAEGVVLSSACSGGAIATIHRNRCYDVTFLNPSNVQWFNDGSTTNYAHYTLASQKVVDLNPNVRAFRHALTLAARDQVLSVPCRQCGAVGGSAASFTNQPGVTAIDFHGSTEACFYDDMDVYGGANIGGKNNRVSSRIRQVLQPTCIRAGELVNTNHDYSGCAIFTSKADSQGYAQWIDIGGITDNISASTQAGGVLDFSNLVIDTSAGNPAVSSKTIEIKNRGYGGSTIKVSFKGAKRVGATSQSNWQRIYVGDIVSGAPFGEIDMRDCDLDGIATRLKANKVLVDGYKSIGSSIMSQLSVGLEVFICDGRALLGDVHVEDCSLSPVNVRGETTVAGTKRAYISNLKAINGNKASGSTTEENSGLALRDLDFAQYNDVITLGLAVNANAVNALRANAVTTLVVGSWYAQGYASNTLSRTGGTAVNMKFGNVT